MQDFLAISDLSPEEFDHLLHLASTVKENWKRGKDQPLLRGKTLGMIFQKPSLRTRVSFDMAMLQLGGHALYLSPQEIGLGQRESVADVARVVSRYVDAIMARVFAHSHVVELAQYGSVPVINGLSDREHPCQALADLLTVYERFGDLRGCKLAFLGDGNNVARSLMMACALTGMEFAIAAPPGYELDEESVAEASRLALDTGGSISTTRDLAEAARGANVLYTDVWASMGQEEEAARRAEVFPPFQLNAERLAEANPEAIVMHCLPAHRGMEITNDVMDGTHSAVFDQAENRMHAQKAVLIELLNPAAAKKLTTTRRATRRGAQARGGRQGAKRAKRR